MLFHFLSYFLEKRECPLISWPEYPEHPSLLKKISWKFHESVLETKISSEPQANQKHRKKSLIYGFGFKNGKIKNNKTQLRGKIA
jgi:hypothetical protein